MNLVILILSATLAAGAVSHSGSTRLVPLTTAAGVAAAPTPSPTPSPAPPAHYDVISGGGPTK